MKKLICFIIFLLFFNTSIALDDYQRNSFRETLDLADDKTEYEQLLKLLDDKRVDLSDEQELSNRIVSESIAFEINPLNYKNIKFAERSNLHSFDINEDDTEFDSTDSYNFQYSYLIGILILIILLILIFLIYKNKDRFRKEEISNTEEQLKEYIKNAKKQGQSEEEIKKELINSNWPRDLMDKYLK